MHISLHDLPDDRRAIVSAITEEWDLPMGTAAKVHMDHPAIASLPKDTLNQTTYDGTLAMLLNAGPLMDNIARLLLTTTGWPSDRLPTYRCRG